MTKKAFFKERIDEAQDVLGHQMGTVMQVSVDTYVSHCANCEDFLEMEYENSDSQGYIGMMACKALPRIEQLKRQIKFQENISNNIFEYYSILCSELEDMLKESFLNLDALEKKAEDQNDAFTSCLSEIECLYELQDKYIPLRIKELCKNSDPIIKLYGEKLSKARNKTRKGIENYLSTQSFKEWWGTVLFPMITERNSVVDFFNIDQIVKLVESSYYATEEWEIEDVLKGKCSDFLF